MSRDFPESDWRVFKRLHALLYERFCGAILEEVEAILCSKNSSAVDRFGQVADLVRQRKEELRQAFGDYRRSTAMLQLHVMRSLEILRDEDLADFSEPTRRAIQTWNS